MVNEYYKLKIKKYIIFISRWDYGSRVNAERKERNNLNRG